MNKRHPSGSERDGELQLLRFTTNKFMPHKVPSNPYMAFQDISYICLTFSLMFLRIGLNSDAIIQPDHSDSWRFSKGFTQHKFGGTRYDTQQVQSNSGQAGIGSLSLQNDSSGVPTALSLRYVTRSGVGTTCNNCLIQLILL